MEFGRIIQSEPLLYSYDEYPFAISTCPEQTGREPRSGSVTLAGMRRTAILLALVLSGVTISACGKSGQASTASHSTTRTPSAATSRAPTRAQALAFAHAVNLTASDVPGFTATPNHHGSSASERRLEQELRSCTGAQGSQSPRSTLVEAGSPAFGLHHGILDLTVSSEVSVAQSAAQAAGTLSAIRSARVRGCVSRYLSQLLKSQHYGGATVTGVSIASGTPPAPGTTGGFGWRVTATLAVHGIHVSFYLDILGFVYGPAQVTLTSSGALRPFPAAAQEQLFSQLLTRARAHSL